MSQVGKIQSIIIDCIKVLNEELDVSEPEEPNNDTRLYGSQSGLDSIGLVSLIADVEDAISEQFDLTIVLADERAMSQLASPFRRVSTLRDYINELVNEAKRS